jgi:hypothetical protein
MNMVVELSAVQPARRLVMRASIPEIVSLATPASRALFPQGAFGIGFPNPGTMKPDERKSINLFGNQENTWSGRGDLNARLCARGGCVLRFLYFKMLKRRDMREDLPYPKERKHLPVILSPAEVAGL